MAKDTQAIFSALMESRSSKKSATNKVLEKIKPAEKKAVKEAVSPLSESFDGTSMVTGVFLKEGINTKLTEGADNLVDDIVDNITVVTDPDKTVDELETRADDIQDAIDNTPEGEAAFSDEYVGDKVYSCPICGESFFAEDDYQPGDVCPICKAEPQDGFLMNGVVAAVEPESEEEVVNGDTDLDTDISTAEGESDIDTKPEEKVEDESQEETIEDTEAEIAGESLTPKTECNDNTIEVNTDDVTIEVTLKEEEKPAEPKCCEVDLDDESFNDVMDEFVEENYSECLESLHVTEATYLKDINKMDLKCEATTKSGVKVPVTFRLTEKIARHGRALMDAVETSRVFKTEGTLPFRFMVSKKDNAIVCESMSYRFVTTHSKAGKVKVEGVARRNSK